MNTIANRKTRERLVPFDSDAIRTRQAAAEAGISIGTLYNYLPFIKTWMVSRPGVKRGIRFVSRSSLKEFMQSQRTEVPYCTQEGGSAK